MLGAGISEIGGPIRTLTLDEPTMPAEGEVVLDVCAAGVGNWDELARIGSWRIGGPPPMALGVEAAGRIRAVGDGVSGLDVGDRVLVHDVPVRRHGTWAERAIVPAAAVAPRPPGVDEPTAAAFPVPALTAAQVIDDALAVERGEWLLVNGASGVTGSLLVQLGVARGAAVVATAGRPNAARLLGYGAREVVDYHDDDWPGVVRQIAGRDGVAKAANAARGGERATLRAVADGGRLATITGDAPDGERRVQISTVYVRADGARLGSLVQLLAEGLLTLEIAAVRPLVEAAEALADAASGRIPGAVVIAPAA
jgi:NADPH:quinone reductase-like Zn-dependent oxidoreductase